MGTRLRYLVDENLDQLFFNLEQLPEEVHVINVIKDKGQWYVVFALTRHQMRNPLTQKDTFNNKGEKNGS